MTSHLQLQARLEDTPKPTQQPQWIGTVSYGKGWQPLSQTPESTFIVTRSCSQKSLLLLLEPCQLQETTCPSISTLFSLSIVWIMAKIWMCHISMTQVAWRIFSSKKVTCFSKDSQITMVKSSEIESYIHDNKFWANLSTFYLPGTMLKCSFALSQLTFLTTLWSRSYYAKVSFKRLNTMPKVTQVQSVRAMTTQHPWF